MKQTTTRPFPPVEGIEVSHRFVDIGGCNIHIAEAGEGEPLFMLHGWPQHWWMWRKQIPFFAKKFKVIVPDIRGFGWSDVTKGGYLKDELSEDFVKLVKVLGYKRIRLISHDWGGWIGYIVTAKYPDLVAQHFACNIPPIWPRLDLKAIVATTRFGYMFRIAMPYFGWRMLRRNGKFVHYLFTRTHTRKEGWTEFEKNAFSDQFTEIARAKASSKLYGDFLVREFIPVTLFRKYSKYHVKTPTRLLFGTKDFAVAVSWLRGAEKHFDDYECELMPGTGHFNVDEQPDIINDRAMKFFRDEKYSW